MTIHVVISNICLPLTPCPVKLQSYVQSGKQIKNSYRCVKFKTNSRVNIAAAVIFIISRFLPPINRYLIM